jgi:hypothetical protein
LPLALRAGLILPEHLHAPKWLLGAIGLIVIGNLWTVFGTFVEASDYVTLAVPFPPAVLIILAGSWAILFILLLLGLLLRHRNAFAGAAPLLSLYGLANLAFAILFTRADYSRGLSTFQLLLTLLLLVPVWWAALRKGWLPYRKITGLDKPLDRQ